MERLASQKNVREALDSLKGANILGMVFNGATLDRDEGQYSYYYRTRQHKAATVQER